MGVAMVLLGLLAIPMPVLSAVQSIVSWLVLKWASQADSEPQWQPSLLRGIKVRSAAAAVQGTCTPVAMPCAAAAAAGRVQLQPRYYAYIPAAHTGKRGAPAGHARPQLEGERKLSA